MVSQCLRTCSPSCSVVMPSRPGAPWLRLTACQAVVAFSRLTISSIRFSYMAFCRSFRRNKLGGLPLPRAWGGFSAWALVSPDQGGDRRCHALPFRTASAVCFQVLIELCSFVLRPFAPPGFHRASTLLRPLLTSRDLSASGSPWVSTDPFLPRRLARRAPSMTLGLRLYSPARPRSRRLTASSCSYGRKFAFGPFA